MIVAHVKIHYRYCTKSANTQCVNRRSCHPSREEDIRRGGERSIQGVRCRPNEGNPRNHWGAFGKPFLSQLDICDRMIFAWMLLGSQTTKELGNSSLHCQASQLFAWVLLTIELGLQMHPTNRSPHVTSAILTSMIRLLHSTATPV